MTNVTTERLPVARLDGEDNTGLRVSIQSVLVCRAARCVRLAQRARAAGNEGRARRLATYARSWAGLPPIKGE